MSNITELRNIFSDIASLINDADKVTLHMSLESGNDALDKHVDSIRSTINQLSICLGVLNVKTLRALKFEVCKEKEATISEKTDA